MRLLVGFARVVRRIVHPLHVPGDTRASAAIVTGGPGADDRALPSRVSRPAPMPRLPALAPFALAAALLAAARPHPAHAQRLTRPERAWTTFETGHFRVHAPREHAAWGRHIAERMEAVRAAERRTIGFVPTAVTDVVIDDPSADPNGSAYPFLDGPAVFLWPTPPGPRAFIGNSRSWGELLAVHEFAHVAHLTRPSRNRWQRVWRSLLPGRIGPVATRSPRWVTEGYATYVEGALTGTGRPHGALRAGLLRQWALEGALPGYDAMSGTGSGFLAGNFAYLMGSAYLEWLAAQRGDSTLPALWRRLSARRNRSFDEAFAGVWGEGPRTLHGRFTAQVTAAAFAARARLDSAGLVEGTLVQRLARGTGDPAVSADGRRLAVALAGGPDGPGRLVIWRAGAEAARDTAADSAFARADRRLLRRDPEDVAPVRLFPPPRTTVATLPAVHGRTHQDPRWLRDGRLLVWRDEPTPDGVLRPDLFLWDTAGARPLRRVTHGANVRQGDPSPDGGAAAAVRCAGGTCDLVRVDLATGAVTTLRAGTLDSVWQRPRWSPDGTRLVAGLQANGRWRVVLLDPGAPGAAPRPLGPADDAERYDAAFAADGRRVAYVSEAGGIANVVAASLDVPGVEAPLTRTTSAAFAPVAASGGTAATDGAWYFLHLTPHGLDLRAVDPSATPVRGATITVQTAPTLLPRGDAAVTSAVAQRPPVPVAPFPTAPVLARPYGVGVRRWAVAPTGEVAPGGGGAGLQVGFLDPVGRLTLLSQATLADRRGWGGGALRAGWRGLPAPLPVTLSLEGFALRQNLGADPATAGGRVPLALRDDARWAGGAAIAEVQRRGAAGGLRAKGALALAGTLEGAQSLRVGGSLARLTLTPTDATGPEFILRTTQRGTRAFGFVEAATSHTASLGTATFGLSLGGHLAAGTTLGTSWRRAIGTARVQAGTSQVTVLADGLLGATGSDAPAWERFAIGGLGTALADDALLAQRVAVGALPVAARTGPRAALARAAVRLNGLEPYFLWTQANDALRGRWLRVAGAEITTVTPFAPFARAPRARVVFGAGYALDEPLKERVRGYARLVFTP